jgi:hypothetical protein
VSFLFDAGGVVAAVRLDLAHQGPDVLGAKVNFQEREVFPRAGGHDGERVGADGVGVAGGAVPGAPAHGFGLPDHQLGLPGTVVLDEADGDLRYCEGVGGPLR